MTFLSEKLLRTKRDEENAQYSDRFPVNSNLMRTRSSAGSDVSVIVPLGRDSSRPDRWR